MDEAYSVIMEELANMSSLHLEPTELEKVKNKIESSHTFGEMSVLNKAMSLLHKPLFHQHILLLLQRHLLQVT